MWFFLCKSAKYGKKYLKHDKFRINITRNIRYTNVSRFYYYQNYYLHEVTFCLKRAKHLVFTARDLKRVNFFVYPQAGF